MMANGRFPRVGWHTATIMIVVFGALATVFSAVSLVGILFLFWTIPGTALGVVCGLVSDRAWRGIAAGFCTLGFFFFSGWALLIGLLWSVFGIGLLLLVGSFFGIAATVACLVELIKTINGQGATSAAYGAYQPSAGPQIVINNSANAQMGHHQFAGSFGFDAAQRGGSAARVGIIERGVARPDVSVGVGQSLVIGRDGGADVRVSDPRVGRRQLAISIGPDGGWSVRDLGQTNHARLLGPGGSARTLDGQAVRLGSGQLEIGDVVVTLYPMDGR